MINFRITLACVSFLMFDFCDLHAGEEEKCQKFGRADYPVALCSSEQIEFYTNTFIQIRDMRKKLSKIKGNKNEDEHSVNVACLAIELRGGGQRITPPVFFGHQNIQSLDEQEARVKDFFNDPALFFDDPAKAYEQSILTIIERNKRDVISKLQEPYFFVSGRLPKSKLSSLNNICYLPETPTQSFLKFREGIENINALVDILPPSYSYLKLLDKNKIVEDFYQNITQLEKDWFEKIKMRSGFIDDCVDDFDPKYTSVLKATFKHERFIQNQETFDDKGKRNEQDEGLFTHSEQLFLARLPNEFEVFLKWIIFLFDIKQPIDEIIFHIPTWNTICARCSLSTLIDFNKEDGVVSRINQYLGNISRNYSLYEAVKPDAPIKSKIFVPAHKKHMTIFRNYEGDIKANIKAEIISGFESWDFDFLPEIHNKGDVILQVYIEKLPDPVEQSQIGFSLPQTIITENKGVTIVISDDLNAQPLLVFDKEDVMEKINMASLFSTNLDLND